jgi:NACHT domain
VQGALQALLAARLTDAPEADAARAREAVRLAIAGAGAAGNTATAKPDRRMATGEASAVQYDETNAAEAPVETSTESVGARYAWPLSEYFDDKISALVAELEGRVGLDGLAQVRAEAYSGRIVALLGAIERQVAALSEPGRGGRTETEWLSRYRRLAQARHGYLYPPDFDRRRKVRAETIYVNTPVVQHSAALADLGSPAMSEQQAGDLVLDSPDQRGEEGLMVMDLAGRLDRTVLLGDPGAGKTTAANVFANVFACDPGRKVPFLVTLREYAAKSPPEWSVAGYIEHTLSALYQCAAPAGLVEGLLLTGRAVVIFDGLDELLDTSRRRDVSDRVEQFCSAFPLTPVLVTSRVVGYNQARLDDTQFTCYRLSGFGDDEVAEYATKWFATQDGIPQTEAAAKTESFLKESADAKDLRTNPLLLSLMCILYRGAGSLPGDRAGVYARCAELMLRKWDDQRDLYRKLGTDHLVEPTLRNLAWWLFTREDSRTVATERELVAKASEFLYGRGYETEEEAQVAAREFVEFCRGRMWVFSDAGTTAGGEELYGFTHRTFMEYFAAWNLAANCDTAESLAHTLAPRIASGGWAVVGELAIKIKSDLSDRGADRIYIALLDPALAPPDKGPLLGFLAALLPSSRPAPATVRALARASFDYAVGRGKPVYLGMQPLWSLLAHGGSYKRSIAEEMSTRMAAMVASPKAATRTDGLRLAVTVPALIGAQPFAFAELPVSDEDRSFWNDWSQEQSRLHAAEFVSCATRDESLRILALFVDMLKPQDALSMPGGLSVIAAVGPLFYRPSEDSDLGSISKIPYMTYLADLLLRPGDPLPIQYVSALTAIGRYIINQQRTPWIHITAPDELEVDQTLRALTEAQLPVLDEAGNLGVAVVLCVSLERVRNTLRSSHRSRSILVPGNGNTHPLLWYINKRLTADASELPELLTVPQQFRQLFRYWAEERVNFVEVLEE